MRRVLIWSILALLFGLPSIPAEANDFEECRKASSSPDSAIEPCSRLIALQSTILPFARKTRAVPYVYRCLARRTRAAAVTRRRFLPRAMI